MDKFLSVFRAYSPERPLRPLLLATGAAAAAAGIYYLVKWTDGNKTTANPEDTSDPGDPVCNGATEPALVRLTEVVQDQMKECEIEQEAHSRLQLHYHEMMETLTNSETVLKASLGEVEEKHQKALETITQLEQEKSNLTYQVKTLQNTMQDMGNQLFYTHLKCEELKNKCEKEQEAHRLLNFEYQEMMETLTNSETVLKASLAEAEKKHQKAEKKHQKAVKTITQLRKEKFNLRDQMKTLRNTMQYMGNQLFYTQLQCDELKKKCERVQKANRLLKSKYQGMMETLTNSETLLKDSMAEAEEKHQKAVEKHQKAVETITQLEQEKSNLTDQECKREQEAHNLLKVQYREMMETNSETVLNDSMAEAEEKHQKAVEKHQKAVETITQLEQQKSNLTDQVKSLQDTMKDMWNQLCDTQLQCDELKKECEQEQEAHRLMKSEYQEMMETLTGNEKLLKVLLAEAEEKHQKAVETITQLEQEKSNLTDQVKSLQDTMKDGENQLCDTQLQCDELKKECEQEQEAHRLMKSEYQEMMETLTKSEKLLKKTGESLGSKEIESNVTQSGCSSESALGAYEG